MYSGRETVVCVCELNLLLIIVTMSLCSNRQYLSNDDCLEDKTEDYQNCCVL